MAATIVSPETSNSDHSVASSHAQTHVLSDDAPSASDNRHPALSATERELVLHEFNATQTTAPAVQLVHEFFEQQVRRTPDAQAVLHGVQSLTYGELNTQANELAQCLRDMGVGADGLVAICVTRSVEMVIGILAILKAGGAYVPLDPSYPVQRLRQVMEDAAPRLVLTQANLRHLLPRTGGVILELDGQWPTANPCEAGHGVHGEQSMSGRNLVYVIHTSGSTGKPKGTAMSHGAMVNLLEWHRRQLRTDPGTRVLQFAALSFDVAFQEIFSTLCGGGTLVLLEEWIRRDSRALARLLTEAGINRLFVPPVMLRSLAEHVGEAGGSLRSLRDVITAGEQLRITAEVMDFFKQLGQCRLHNHYGPTETHVVTALTLTGDPQTWPALPTIGRPIANTSIYILDAELQPVAIGVAGEIYIGGAGVARGYLNRAELTAQRFVRDEFSADPQARMYRTGDLGRWRADGTIEYLGRNDQQVKIRGFRIELGEIEAQLARHEQVKDAVVVAREDVAGDKRLVGYVTRHEGCDASVEELRRHLGGVLPEYMVPSAFVVLERLPLTPSGKIDRRALPAPELDAYLTRQYEPPQGAVEQLLAEIWQKLLRVERIGRHDNFFELGGDSLSMVHAMERLRQAGFRAEARSFFEAAVLKDLASILVQHVDDAHAAPSSLIPDGCAQITPQMLPLVDLTPEQLARIIQAVPGGAANIEDIYPLAPIQEGILFHHLLSGHEGDTYVLPILLSFAVRDGVTQFIKALQQVMDRHAILRTAIFWTDSRDLSRSCVAERNCRSRSWR